MSLVHLLVLTGIAPIGAVYVYLGSIRNDYLIIAAGIGIVVSSMAMALSPAFGIVTVLLCPAPFLVRKILNKIHHKK
jgi:hypothetical protein